MQKKQILGLILVPFGPDLVLNFFLWVLCLLDVRHCCKLSLYAISRTTNEPNLRKWQKPSFGLMLAHLPEIRATKFFFSKIWLCQSLDIMVIYHHVQYQKKLLIQSWENLVTDGRPKKFYMAKIKDFPKNKYLNMKN